MNKVKLCAATALLVLFGVLGILGCGSEPSKLETPQNVRIEDEILMWDEVPNAQGYTVEINGERYETASNSLDIFLLTTEFKVYEMTVTAYGDIAKYIDSEKSQPVTYECKQPQGLKLRLINNGTEYGVFADTPNTVKGKVVLPAYAPDRKPITEICAAPLPKNQRGLEKCVNMTGLVMPDTITKIGEGGFLNCENLARIRLSRGLKTIENSSFMNCKSLNNIDLPDGLETIGTGTFSHCESLESIDIPIAVYNIASAFMGCKSLATITVDERNRTYKSDENCLVRKSDNYLAAIGTMSDVIPGYIQIIGDYTFRDRSDITSIAIPYGVRKIGDRAFAGCGGLTELSIPQSVEEIGDWAFAGCGGLTELIIPQSVEKIGWGTFKDCVGISYLNIPGSLNSIEKGAFDGCIGLKRVEFAEGVESIGSPADGIGAFQYCSELESVVLPSTVHYINACTFIGCEKLMSITVAEDNPVYSSDGNCILNKSGDTLFLCAPKAQVPEYIEYIGEKAFYGYSRETLIIPSAVKSIGNSSFVNSSIEYLVLPESLLSLGGLLFDGNDNVGTVTIPCGLERMGRNAFNRVSFFTCRSEVNPSGWGSDDRCDWYADRCGYALNCVYGYDGVYPYVQSVKASSSLVNIKLPYRLGHAFAGWALAENGDRPDFGLVEDDNGNLSIALSREQISELPRDTVLYAVWQREDRSSIT